MVNNKENIDRWLPKNYLKDGYFYQKGNDKVIRKEYIVDFPQEIAQNLSRDKNTNKRSQIRKFYEYALRIQVLMRRNENDYQLLEADLMRLKPFVRYAQTRGRVSELFVEFIERNLSSIHSIEDFEVFVKHFEAVIAYLKEDDKKEYNKRRK